MASMVFTEEIVFKLMVFRKEQSTSGVKFIYIL